MSFDFNDFVCSKPEYLYGINSVKAALSANWRQMDKLYLNIGEKGKEEKSNTRIEEIHKLATSKGIKTKFITKVIS